MFIHEDRRRKLIEVIADESFRSIKVIHAKDGCIVGNHYHKLKDEKFFLIQGRGTARIAGIQWEIQAGDLMNCPRDVPHTFILEEGSILLGLATGPYDEEDEHLT